MNHELAQLFAERLSGGIRRKSIRSCSRWASEYRVMGKPYPGKWSFDHHPWIRTPHDDETEEICVQKAAQLAWTEWALNKTFYNIDIKGNSVLYILPAATPDARDFSTARFDPALELSAHLQSLFDDVKNIHHKRSGNANLYIRGSRVKSQLKSVPVSLIILDEINVAINYGLVDVQEVINIIGLNKKAELVLTGRNAHPKIKKMADLVTEMKKSKHYFDRGLKARKGIEY